MKYINYSKRCFFAMSITAVAVLFSTSVLKANAAADSSPQPSQVVASKYTELLTAVASVQDTSGLYNESMSDIITQSKTSSGYSYSVVPGKEDELVTLSDENQNGLDDLNNRLLIIKQDAPPGFDPRNHAGDHSGQIGVGGHCMAQAYNPPNNNHSGQNPAPPCGSTWGFGSNGGSGN
ncbi:MAG: hypothetical protein K2W97_00275 [Chthoniobacterales bacterium]|nr:hypothetical protein [Chthoniobacterales bacterium]